MNFSNSNKDNVEYVKAFVADQCNLVSVLGVSAPILNLANVEPGEKSGVPFPFPDQSSFASFFSDGDEEEDDSEERDEFEEEYLDDDEEYDVPADMENEDGVLDPPEEGYEYYYDENYSYE